MLLMHYAILNFPNFVPIIVGTSGPAYNSNEDFLEYMLFPDEELIICYQIISIILDTTLHTY